MSLFFCLFYPCYLCFDFVKFFFCFRLWWHIFCIIWFSFWLFNNLLCRRCCNIILYHIIWGNDNIILGHVYIVWRCNNIIILRNIVWWNYNIILWYVYIVWRYGNRILCIINNIWRHCNMIGWRYFKIIMWHINIIWRLYILLALNGLRILLKIWLRHWR